MSYVPQNRANLVAAATAQTAGRRKRRRWRLPVTRVTRRTLALAAIVTAVPAGVAVGVIKIIHEAPPREAPITNPVGSGPDRKQLPRVPTSLLDAYGHLGMAATAEDRDDAVIRRYAEHARAFGLDAKAARVVAHIDGKRLWLVPGNGFVCLGVQDPADPDALTTGCNTEAVALRDGVSANDNTAIYGVLPDGIHQIEVTDDDGFRHVEPVHDNAYVLRNVSATVRYPVGAKDQEMFRIIGTGP